MRPVLASTADGAPHRIRELMLALADQLSLSEAERAKLLPSGTQRVFDNRVAWAATYLRKANLLSRPQRGYVQITPAGQQVLAENPERVDVSVLSQFPLFIEFR